MKKYKSTPSKKYAAYVGQTALEELIAKDESVMSMVPPETEEQVIRIAETDVLTDQEAISDMIEAVPLELEPTEDPASLTESSDEIEAKPRKRLWPHGAKKSIEAKPHSEHKDEIYLERKREPMNNTPIESNIKEPNAVISKMMNITGNIELDTSLLLAGKVVGNIDCKAAIEVYPSGNVEGNISVASIKLAGGEVKGDISCEGTLETDSETVINGDVSAQVIILRGKVTGQVKASESVALSSTAVVKGDLTSATISVEKGAKLEGKYTVAA